uniref:SH3 domain-containing protein n=1 Tax=Ganoderma boninense TaxID=34458 RepID=A0A5K1JYV8_9APHY|nr:SH3 domain-containing protein [Ganoderma boninense]
MKSLRKSLNGNKDQHHNISTPSPLPSLSKPSTAIQPPKKVIRALGPYKSTAPQELSFDKGDFFHVLHDNGGLWYEAHNPMTGARGLVPSNLFEEFSKGAPTPRSPKHPTPTERLSHISSAPNSPKLKTFYAIVLHDFKAERGDELESKSGDPITVVAQSNREWFVAKPIGRLGRPGLIPASFVEIRDPATGQAIPNVQQLIDNGELPRVEEWKRAVLTYKANSITLGVLDDPTSQLSPDPRTSAPQPEPMITVHGATPLPGQSDPIPEHPSRPLTPKLLPEGILLSAEIKSYHYEADEYWFRVRAIYQPYGPSRSSSLPPAKELVLFRSYNDFYDFQVELLDTFPHEAGRPDTSTRILPYMPGPADVVDNEITNNRREELDEYLHKLCDLKTYARYILEHALVRSFCALKPGDGEVNVEPRRGEIDAIRQSTYEEARHTYADTDVAADQLSRLGVSSQNRLSDGSRYEDDAPSSDPYYSQPSARSQSRAGHQRVDSANSYRQFTNGGSRTHSPHPSQSYSRTQSPISAPSGGHQRSRTPLEIDPYEANSRSSLASSHDPSPISMRSSQAGSVHTAATSASGRSRSASNAAYNPPISATNPNTAFLKIKIFDRVSDDLVAIRVHPKVTHGQLMDKVQARLGGNVLSLRYRDSLSNDFVPLGSDGDLRVWLDSTDRHVLYAE